jgi:hypothetical protein
VVGLLTVDDEPRPGRDRPDVGGRDALRVECGQDVDDGTTAATGYQTATMGRYPTNPAVLVTTTNSVGG